VAAWAPEPRPEADMTEDAEARRDRLSADRWCVSGDGVSLSSLRVKIGHSQHHSSAI